MALRKYFLPKSQINNTGFSEKTEGNNIRLIHKDGNINVTKKGIAFWESFSFYHYILEVSNIKFALIVMGFYTVVNLFFAGVYLLIGTQHLNGIISNGGIWEDFEEAYFFSSQTLTTVGYGRISPVGLLANTIASFEALTGILTLAIVTGLLYGRFVKPRAFIKFSKNTIIRPFKDKKALMVRLAPTKKHRISQVSSSIHMMLEVEEKGVVLNKFFSLPLELDFISSLYLSWTLVHIIDENSPLYTLSIEDMKKGNLQIHTTIKAFDEGFSNTVLAYSNYIFSEIVFNHQFEKMSYYSDKLQKMVVDFRKLDALTPITNETTN